MKFFDDMEWKEWLMLNLRKNYGSVNEVHWPLTFGVALDNLWLRRNQLLFQQTDVSNLEFFHQVMAMVHNIVSSENLLQPLQTKNSSNNVFTQWVMLEARVVALNTDVTVALNGTLASCGGSS